MWGLILRKTKQASILIVPHDVEEFWDIIDDVGLRWCEMDAYKETTG